MIFKEEQDLVDNLMSPALEEGFGSPTIERDARAGFTAIWGDRVDGAFCFRYLPMAEQYEVEIIYPEGSRMEKGVVKVKVPKDRFTSWFQNLFGMLIHAS